MIASELMPTNLNTKAKDAITIGSPYPRVEVDNVTKNAAIGRIEHLPESLSTDSIAQVRNVVVNEPTVSVFVAGYVTRRPVNATDPIKAPNDSTDSPSPILVVDDFTKKNANATTVQLNKSTHARSTTASKSTVSVAC